MIELFGTYQGPIPYWVENALVNAGHNEPAHYAMYLAGHSQYNKHIDYVSLTQKGRDYHVSLMMGEFDDEQD